MIFLIYTRNLAVIFMLLFLLVGNEKLLAGEEIHKPDLIIETISHERTLSIPKKQYPTPMPKFPLKKHQTFFLKIRNIGKGDYVGTYLLVDYSYVHNIPHRVDAEQEGGGPVKYKKTVKPGIIAPDETAEVVISIGVPVDVVGIRFHLAGTTLKPTATRSEMADQLRRMKEGKTISPESNYENNYYEVDLTGGQ
jgi:hypothetical protein